VRTSHLPVPDGAGHHHSRDKDGEDDIPHDNWPPKVVAMAVPLLGGIMPAVITVRQMA
jgi:hypothetical protein